MKKQTHKQGFTLIETLVAITVLLASIAGPLTLAQRGLQSAEVSRNQITANFLAQEGVEFIIHTRDTNNLQAASWLAGLDLCRNGQSCEVDATAGTITSCGTTCDPLKYDTATGRYGYTFSTVSPYTRTVTVTDIVADREVQVTSTVTWPQGSLTRQFAVHASLFKW